MFTSTAAQEADNTLSLRFWHPYNDERQAALDTLVEEFNRQHQGRIDIQAIGFSNSGLLYDQMILQLQNPTSLPNLILVWPYEAALFDLADVVIDLALYTDAETPQGYNPQTEKLLGIPDRVFYPILIVNQDALHQLGTDAPPTNLDDLQNLACRFRESGGWSGGKFGVAWGYLLPFDAEVWLGLWVAQNPFLFDNGAFHFNTPTVASTLQALLDAQTKGCIASVTLSTDAVLTFAEGRALFYLGSSSSLNLVQETIAATFVTPFEVGVYPFISNQHVLTYGPALSIINHDEETNAAAWTFIDWWQQPIQHQQWMDATDTPSISPEWATIPLPALAGYDVIRLEMRGILQQVMAGTLPLDEGLHRLDSNINRIINDFSKESR